MREILGRAKCKCSICKKVFYHYHKDYYMYMVDDRYQCSYTCYLKAKAKRLAKTKRKGRNKLKDQYGTVAPAVRRTEPNVELTKIYAVENRYGLGCWTRTDDTFLNDPDVIFIRSRNKRTKRAAS